ncbi:shikimate dehydrogenase [Sapientia aquatica]|uniref:Shikimate dehydrogenase (NADP(+)) n=1 Tax=Sapientia aquatica TaxID=1549640 RepID=A0A4R5VYW7_9BURK|nr:shikimate dehydrogenase [Sapientia aquatica]TDK64548.1 shikimate dehydrogenase [Sapientia aquatica]
MSSSKDRYVVLGNPIAHSKSPFLHTHFAQQTQQNLDYRPLLAPLDEFDTTVNGFIAQGGKGANVTLPFKLQAFALCTELTPRAKAAGAVNTLLFKTGHIIGDNTDGCGLVNDIVHNAGVNLTGQRILLLGAGGAARGALLPLLECQPAQIVIANRTVARAEELATQFQPFGNVLASSFEAVNGAFDLIINATSASINAEVPPVPASVFSPNCFAYDMMYGNQPTVFMQHAAAQGATTRDGWGMLVEQAAEAFYLWRGVKPATDALLKQHP